MKVTLLALIAVVVSVSAWSSAGAEEAGVLRGVVLTNDRTVDATSNEAIARGLFTEGMGEQQKAYALWRFFIQRNRHKEKAPSQDDGNAAELMTKTGYALCGTWAHHYASLAASAGMTATRVGLNGHVIAAVKYWDDWHAYDPDMLAIYPKADGVVASPQDIRDLKDPAGGFVLRNAPPVKPYPWYMAGDSINGTAKLYARVSMGRPYPKRPWKWSYDLSLRPGAVVSWSWYGDPDVGFVSLSHLPNVRSKRQFKNLREYLLADWDYYQQKAGKPKWSWGNRRGGLPGNPLASWNGINGNGRLTYDLRMEGFRFAMDMMASSSNISADEEGIALVDASKAGWFTLDFSLPYPYGDAWIAKPLPPDGLKIELAVGDRNFREVYPKGGADDGKRIRLFDSVRSKTDFRLKVSLAAGASPIKAFKAIGAFHHNFMVLPSLVQGSNTVSVRADNADALTKRPLYVTYSYDLAAPGAHGARAHPSAMRETFTFKPGKMKTKTDMGVAHWPLMKSIAMCWGAEPTQNTSDVKDDWASAPWDWAFHGVNFWNDFERGDRHGWRGKLTSTRTAAGSDFALDNSLILPDGRRQLKLIRHGALLNRDSKFACGLYLENAKSLRVYSRNQDDLVYYEKTYTNLVQGKWQRFEFAFGDLADPKDNEKKAQNNWFMSNVYMVVEPAEGKATKDVSFLIDDVICWDGVLKHDPLTDPDAPRKALQADPVWNAKPPTP